MKKFLALALALVMALALAVPAMAFTNDVEDEYVYELGIELVEYENDEFFGIVGYAPSDRGYAKNEIVAFIVSFTVPKGTTNGDYNFLKVFGENVTFDVKEKEQASSGQNALALGGEGNLYAAIADMDATKSAKTAKWLGFAKVTGDDASLTAEVFKAGAPKTVKFKASGTDATVLFIEDEDENVYKIDHVGQYFGVFKNDEYLFGITLDKNNKSTALLVKDYKVLVNNDGEWIFVHDTTADVLPGVKAQKALYEQLVGIVEDEFEGVFGFDYDLLGGLVTEKYFEGLASYDKLSVTVDIAPWVAYVQVPDVIVVDPPKTGDATVLVGIVMAIVAAAGVVVFNKVRA